MLLLCNADEIPQMSKLHPIPLSYWIDRNKVLDVSIKIITDSRPDMKALVLNGLGHGFDFGNEHPGSVPHSRITSCGPNDVGQFANHAELLFAVQHVDGSEDLDAHVIAAAGGIRNRFARQFMNKSSGVLFEEINGRDVFP